MTAVRRIFSILIQIQIKLTQMMEDQIFLNLKRTNKKILGTNTTKAR